MRKASDKIWSLIQPVVETMDYELVGIEHLSQGRHSVLRVYIDHENGITVDDCASVSHQISGLLDVEEPVQGNYSLEVSSPGLDRPLFTLEHFKRFAGATVQLRLHSPIEGRRKMTATLNGVDGEQVELEVDEQTLHLTLDDIDTARLVPVFD
ncbi:MAG: ribosome maturation factor RimP [Gammaproteobacteria bacterium]|nr:ribosome maturation factor RimP [Gammaproteobacteria bacterium]